MKTPHRQHTTVWFAQNHTLILQLRIGYNVRHARNGHMNFVPVEIPVADTFAIVVTNLFRLRCRIWTICDVDCIQFWFSENVKPYDIAALV